MNIHEVNGVVELSVTRGYELKIRFRHGRVISSARLEWAKINSQFKKEHTEPMEAPDISSDWRTALITTVDVQPTRVIEKSYLLSLDANGQVTKPAQLLPQSIDSFNEGAWSPNGRWKLHIGSVPANLVYDRITGNISKMPEDTKHYRWTKQPAICIGIGWNKSGKMHFVRLDVSRDPVLCHNITAHESDRLVGDAWRRSFEAAIRFQGPDYWRAGEPVVSPDGRSAMIQGFWVKLWPGLEFAVGTDKLFTFTILPDGRTIKHRFATDSEWALNVLCVGYTRSGKYMIGQEGTLLSFESADNEEMHMMLVDPVTYKQIPILKLPKGSRLVSFTAE